MQQLYPRIREAFHTESSPLYRGVQGFVWLLIVVSIVVFSLDPLFGVDVESHPLLRPLDDAILILFVIELVLRVGTYEPPQLKLYGETRAERLRLNVIGRMWFCVQPLTLIDILCVLTFYPALRGLRALRLLRLARSLKLFRYSSPFEGLTRALADNTLLFGFAFSLLGVIVTVGGISMYLVERAANPGVNTLTDGIWWALVTITTVGFGDISPVTGVGRAVAAVLMVAGMFMLALFAGLVGRSLVHAVLSIQEEQFRMSVNVNHIVICGYDRGSRMLLDVIREEFEDDQVEIVVFDPAPRPDDLPPEFSWIRGDPTKESELGKVRLSYARAAVLVGSRDLGPQEADAMTILTAFTIRRFLNRSERARKRLHPLYIVAEVLDSENVDHAKTAGVDEVIESIRTGFSMLTHALLQHGTGNIIGEVARSTGHSLYLAPVFEDIEVPTRFGDLATRVRAESGALLLGFRSPSPDTPDSINPPDDLLVPVDVHLVYLAETPLLPPVPED